MEHLPHPGGVLTVCRMPKPEVAHFVEATRQHVLEAMEVMIDILRDPSAPHEVRRAAEQVLIERGFIRLPDGPMRPCRVH